jgi:hypothetical protein
MDRFFSYHNLQHYRRLASAALPAPERNRILEALADQWNVFRRECHGSAVHLEIGFQHTDAGKRNAPKRKHRDDMYALASWPFGR